MRKTAYLCIVLTFTAAILAGCASEKQAAKAAQLFSPTLEQGALRYAKIKEADRSEAKLRRLEVHIRVPDDISEKALAATLHKALREAHARKAGQDSIWVRAQRSWELGSKKEFAGDLVWAPEGKWNDPTHGAEAKLVLTCNLIRRRALAESVQDHLGPDVRVEGVERGKLLRVTIPIDKEMSAWSRAASSASVAEAARRELASSLYQIDPLHGFALEITITYQGRPVAHARATHAQLAAAAAAMNAALSSPAGRALSIPQLDAIYLSHLPGYRVGA